MPEARDRDPKADKPLYETPTVTLMDEKEVLKVFQFTSAAVSWWH